MVYSIPSCYQNLLHLQPPILEENIFLYIFHPNMKILAKLKQQKWRTSSSCKMVKSGGSTCSLSCILDQSQNLTPNFSQEFKDDIQEDLIKKNYLLLDYFLTVIFLHYNYVYEVLKCLLSSLLLFSCNDNMILLNIRLPIFLSFWQKIFQRCIIDQ